MHFSSSSVDGCWIASCCIADVQGVLISEHRDGKKSVRKQEKHRISKLCVIIFKEALAGKSLHRILQNIATQQLLDTL